MRSFFLLLMLLPLFLFSQESELVSNTSEGFKGISIGLLFEAQTKYPNPYYGPNVGAVRCKSDRISKLTYKKIILGIELSVEELATIKEHAGNIIKNLDAY